MYSRIILDVLDLSMRESIETSRYFIEPFKVVTAQLFITSCRRCFIFLLFEDIKGSFSLAKEQTLQVYLLTSICPKGVRFYSNVEKAKSNQICPNNFQWRANSKFQSILSIYYTVNI